MCDVGVCGRGVPVAIHSSHKQDGAVGGTAESERSGMTGVGGRAGAEAGMIDGSDMGKDGDVLYKAGRDNLARRISQTQ